MWCLFFLFSGNLLKVLMCLNKSWGLSWCLDLLEGLLPGKQGFLHMVLIVCVCVCVYVYIYISSASFARKWPIFDVCVANLPYQISSPFTFKLLAHRPAFRCAVLMFQKEFAERLIAKVGESQYGRLAVNTSLFVKVTCVCKVGRMNFTPPPEVDSMVVKIVPRFPPIEVDFREWDGLMRICFGRKRKTLRSSFCMSYTLKTLEDNYTTWCALTGCKPDRRNMKDKVVEVLAALKLSDKRAIKIDLDTYFKLLLEFNTRGIHFTNVNVGTKIGESDAPQLPDDLFMDEDRGTFSYFPLLLGSRVG